jgi:ABC-2 type transport system permease protein
MPLTHLVNAARTIMLDGGGILAVSSELLILLLMAVLMIAIAARMFRWQKD